jgi:flagellar hook assembly protein FlgD
MRSESAESTGEAVRISVYNIKGQLVKTLVNEYKVAGQHKVVWNGESDQGMKVSSGIYFYRMETKTGSSTKKMLLVK